jgi:hypothetical protein
MQICASRLHVVFKCVLSDGACLNGLINYLLEFYFWEIYLPLHSIVKLFFLVLRQILTTSKSASNISCHLEPLLGNDSEISDYTTTVGRKWPHQQTRTQKFHGNNCTATEERYFLRGSCRDVISKTNEGSAVSEVKSELVRGLLGFSYCELLQREAGSWDRGQFGNAEEGERPPLEAVTRRLVKTEQAVKT